MVVGRVRGGHSLVDQQNPLNLPGVRYELAFVFIFYFHLLKKRDQFFGEDVCSESVGRKVLLDAFLGQLSLVDHAAGVVDQDVKLLVLADKVVGKL